MEGVWPCASTISSSLSGKWRAVIRWVLGAQAALLVGVGARFWYYFLNDSFWRDESKLLINVAQKSFLGLLGPLNYDQESPFPLLWLYRLIYLAGGGGELSMRAVSLVASIAGLFLFYVLARKVMTDHRAISFSVWLLALAPGVILFAAITKVVALDILVATVLLILAAPIFTSKNGEKEASNSFQRLLWAAAIAPWLSYPAIFVLGGIGAGLLIKYRTIGIFNLIKFIGITILSEVVQMFIVLNRLVSPATIDINHNIIQIMNSISNWWLWLFCQIYYGYLGPKLSSMFMYYPYAYYFDPFAMFLSILTLLGLWEAGRQWGWAWICVLAGPLLLALTASILRLYRPYGRLLLFATPGIYLLSGYGAAWLFRKVPKPWVISLALIILVLPCGNYSWVALGKKVGGVREGLKYVYDRQQPGDLVFVDVYAAPTVYYYILLNRPYAKDLHYGMKPEKWIEGEVHDFALKPEDVLPLIPSERRVWLVAESMDSVRGPVAKAMDYWGLVEEKLYASRAPLSAYVTDRVQVLEFSPAFK